MKTKDNYFELLGYIIFVALFAYGCSIRPARDSVKTDYYFQEQYRQGQITKFKCINGVVIEMHYKRTEHGYSEWGEVTDRSCKNE